MYAIERCIILEKFAAMLYIFFIVISKFNDISTLVAYLLPNQFLLKNSGE